VAVDEVDESWPDAWRDFHHGVRVGVLELLEAAREELEHQRTCDLCTLRGH